MECHQPHKMLLQPWGIYVNGKSSNKDAAWGFLKFLTNHENSLRLTSMTGWVSARQDVNWKPLLAKTPQFEVFVSPPKDMDYYVEPILTAWDEIEIEARGPSDGGVLDPSLKGNPQKVAAPETRWRRRPTVC